MLSAVVVGLRTLALLPMHAHRGQAFQGVTPSFHLSNYQLSKQRYFVVCPLTFYRQRTSRTYPKIFAGLIAISLRVDDDRIDQLENVLLAADVAERVVVHGFPEIDGIQRLDDVAALFKHFAALYQHRTLRVLSIGNE